MKAFTRKTLLMSGLGAVIWLCNGDMVSDSSGFLVGSAEARFGRPMTPVSYAGVARRTTRRAVTPGVGAPGVGLGGVGGPASGVGVRPGAGAGKAGVGYSGGVGANVGGPVNRVGVR